jgi:hypothetical protein
MPGGKDFAMQSRHMLVLFGALLAVICGFSGAGALASTPFAITSTNVTMPMTGGLGFSYFTVSGIPGDGIMTLSCAYSGPTTVAKIPICPMTPPVAYTVTAGETLTGQIDFYPYGSAIPASQRGASRRSGYLPASSLALAGALMFGFGLRRRARRWLTLVLLAAGTLAGVGAISGCINPHPMTPGTYQYTITANWSPSSVVPFVSQATTNIEVTVP